MSGGRALKGLGGIPAYQPLSNSEYHSIERSSETVGNKLQKQPPFKKCVIAYSSRDPAPKMIGDKHDTEALDVRVLRDSGVVEEHCHLH